MNPEQALYEEVWQDPAYRRVSPGERQVPDCMSKLPIDKEDSIIDVGCGTGKAIAAFQDLGYTNIEGCDIADNAKNPELSFPFSVVDMTREAPDHQVDWVYCCDVLEHVPEEDLPAALDYFWAVMKLGGYYQIALFPETHYGPMGSILHKNVQSTEYWVMQFTEAFGKEYTIDHQSDGRRMTLWLQCQE